MALARAIRPDEFIQAEVNIKNLLEAKGYIVQAWGYEHQFTEKARDSISHINKPTSLYIRTTPDKCVIGSKESLLVEIKDASEPNIALEAFPILIHRHLYWTFNIVTIYLFVSNENITGEFVENLPISRVIIPSRLRTAEINYWTPLLHSGFPNNKIERIPTGGSGDPFIIISNEQRKQFKTLKELL